MYVYATVYFSVPLSRDICVALSIQLLYRMWLWTGVHVSLWELTLNSFRYTVKNRIAGLYGNFIFMILRSWHMVFLRDCKQQCTVVPISPYPYLHWWFCFVYMQNAFYGSYSNGCEAISCSSDLFFQWQVLLGICYALTYHM